MRSCPSRRLLAAFAILCFSAAPCSAQTYTWAPGADQSWSNVANWSPSTVPNAASVTALFNGTNALSVDVDSTFSLGRLRFEQLGSPSTYYVFSTTSGGSLTFDNGGNPSVIESLAGSGSIQVFINTPVIIAGSSNSLQVNNAGSASVGIFGVLSGSASALTINANAENGVVHLANANTYGGTGSVTTVAGGVLRANDGTGLPSITALVLNGGVFETIGSQTFTRSLGTGSGEVSLAGRAGFSVFIGATNIRLNNGNGTVTWGSANFNPTTLVLGASPFTETFNSSRVIWENGINLGGATRTISAESAVNGGQSFGRISGAISNGGLTKAGNGLLELTATNTYTGPTTISAGILRANHGTGLPASSALTINGGVLESIGPATLARSIGTGSGQVELVTGGFSASGGTMTVQLNGGTGAIAWGSTGFLAGGSALTLGSASSNALVDFQNGLNLGGVERTVQVVGNSLAASSRARLSGPITNGSLTIIGTGPAVLELTGTNTYAGDTHVQNATLRAKPGQGLSASSPLWLDGAILESMGAANFTRTLGTGAGEVRLSANSGFSASGGTMTIQLNGGTGNVAFGQTHFVPAAAALVFGSSVADNLVDFQNGLDLAAGTGTVRVIDNPLTTSDRARISGVIANGALTKEGSGVLELTGANTYSGTTTVVGGVLRANHGTGLPIASALLLDNFGVIEGMGTVTFMRTLGSGAGEIEIGSGGGGFSASGGVMTIQLNGGTGAVVLGNGALVLGSAASNNLVDFQNGIDLDGGNKEIYSFGGQARISGVIQNGTFAKFGPGTLELSAANTHSGTVVGAGKLLVNNASGSATGTGSVVVLDGATLSGHGKIINAEFVNVNAGSKLAPGDAGGNTLSISTTGSINLSGTWSVKLQTTGAPSAANSGGSTAGNISGSNPDPGNHNFLFLSSNSQANQIFFTSDSKWEIDGTGLTFLPYTHYSYVIGRTGVGELDAGTLPTDQAQFSTIGFGAYDFSVTSHPDGRIIMNFTSTPEPATVLGVAAAGMGVLGTVRRRFRR